MNNNILYTDKLVKIDIVSILFRQYYFPNFSKSVKFSEVSKRDELDQRLRWAEDSLCRSRWQSTSKTRCVRHDASRWRVVSSLREGCY